MTFAALSQMNTASAHDAAAMLDGIYEHSLWVAEQTVLHRPFKSLSHLKQTMATVVGQSGKNAQISLIQAHPELAGKAMVNKTLTAESNDEQSLSGLTHCSPHEFAQIQSLNAAYNTKFGWPFILAVRGPSGLGLTRHQILATFERRLNGHPDFELQECLRNIHRIAELRLADRFGVQPKLGQELWQWHEELARHSDPGYQERGQLTVTYLTDAHQACANDIAQRMRDCGFDTVEHDAVGNVVGCYYSDSSLPPQAIDIAPNFSTFLMTGSQFDTVRNGGKYDGRLGIFVPIMAVRELSTQSRRLPFGIEVVAFAEEEGQRYKATFLGSGALLGQFKPEWLEQRDTDGVSMEVAMRSRGMNPQAIGSVRRDPKRYMGFVEVHIEQGPVLNEQNLPLGIVTSINGSLRYACTVIGTASHAGTTPMNRRRDAAAAVAELSVYIEERAAKDGDSVATMGMLNVPNGSTNVVPGRCDFTLDLRAPSNSQRDALAIDVLAELSALCDRRGVQCTTERTMDAAAAPSDAAWQKRWEVAVEKLGLPLHHMPSGAGHDAMKLHEIMPQAMLFVRGENAGISHNPLESTHAHDLQLAVEAFQNLLDALAVEAITPTR